MKDFINSKDEINDVIDSIEGSKNAIKQEYNNIHKADDLDEELAHEYKLKRRILVRDICGYLASMTDI